MNYSNCQLLLSVAPVRVTPWGERNGLLGGREGKGREKTYNGGAELLGGCDGGLEVVANDEWVSFHSMVLLRARTKREERAGG